MAFDTSELNLSVAFSIPAWHRSNCGTAALAGPSCSSSAATPATAQRRVIVANLVIRPPREALLLLRCYPSNLVQPELWIPLGMLRNRYRPSCAHFGH